MAKYRVYKVQTGWIEHVDIFEVNANSQEEAEENYHNGEYVDSWDDQDFNEFGIDSERTELIEE